MRDKQPLCHAEMRFLQVYSGYVDPHVHNSEESAAFFSPQGSNVVETAAIIGCCLVLLTWLLGFHATSPPPTSFSREIGGASS